MIRLRYACLLFALFTPFPAFASSDALAPLAYTPSPLPTRGAAWVSPTGSDTTGNGSETQPFLTVERASQAPSITTILLTPGRHTQFGTIRRGGSAQEPLVIRSASTGTVEIVVQDATRPTTITASHVRLEGITLQGGEAGSPETCLQLSGDLDDIELAFVRIRGCETGMHLGQGAISHLVMRDSFFTDLAFSAIDGSEAASLHHRLERVQIERIGHSSQSAIAVRVSDRSRDIRWRDVIVRDVEGHGAIFFGARPSIANSQFMQIRDTALTLHHGGYLARVDIAALHEGLRARVGENLVIERSLLRALAATSTTLVIEEPSAPSQTTGTLLLAYSRIEVPTSTLVLGAASSAHEVVWQSDVFWFSHEATRIRLPGGVELTPEESAQSSRIVREGNSQLLYGSANQNDLFDPFFKGGETVHGDNGTRVISAGSQLQGETNGGLYVFGVDDRAHFVPSLEQRDRWYTQGEVNILKEARLGDIPRGDDLTEPPGMLIKTAERPQVYLVVAPNLLRWIMNERLAEAYAGPRWAQSIVLVPKEAMTQYEEIEPIKTLPDFEANDVLRQVPDPGDLFE